MESKSRVATSRRFARIGLFAFGLTADDAQVIASRSFWRFTTTDIRHPFQGYRSQLPHPLRPGREVWSRRRRGDLSRGGRNRRTNLSRAATSAGRNAKNKRFASEAGQEVGRDARNNF